VVLPPNQCSLGGHCRKSQIMGANPEVIGKVGEASCTGTWQLGEYGLFHILRH